VTFAVGNDKRQGIIKSQLLKPRERRMHAVRSQRYIMGNPTGANLESPIPGGLWPTFEPPSLS
jgi:hypothetical protein